MPRLLALVAVFAAAVPATAQTYVWNPVTGNWSVPGNWTPNGPPPSGTSTVLNFGGVADYTSTHNIGSGTFQLNQLNVTNTGATTIAGAVAANTLTFAGSAPALTVGTLAGATTVSAGVVYSANTTVTNNSANLLTLGGPQTFNGNTVVTYAGPGTISLSPTIQAPSLTFAAGSGITYTGSGQLNVGPQTGSTAALNAIIFANNGTYNFVNGVSGGNSTGVLSLGDNTSGAANGTILYNAATGVTLNLSNFSSGLLTVGNFGEMTGTVNVLAGTVRFGAFGQAANTGGNLFGASQVLNVASGATFNFNGNGESMGAITGSGTITGASVTAQLVGNYTWAGNFATSNLGTSANVNYTLTGTNASTGNLTAAASSTVAIGNGGTGGAWAGPVVATGTVQFNRSDAYTQASVVSGAGTVAQVGTGTTTLSGANTFTAAVSVTNGTLAFANAGAYPTANVQTTVNGGVLDLSAISGGYTYGTGRTLTVGKATASTDVFGAVTVSGNLNVAGTGTVGTATFRDALTLNAGNALFDLSSNPASGNDRVAVGSLTLSGTNTVQVNTLNGQLGTGTYTLISYAGTVTGGAANLSLSGIAAGTTRQSFTFNTTAPSNGAVTLTVAGSPASLTWANTTGNGQWDLVTSVNWTGAPGATPDNRFYNFDAVTFGDTAAGTVTLVGTLQPSATTVNSAADYTFAGSGLIGGSGTLVKSGAGTLTVGTANTYAGSTTLSGGTLTFASGGSIAGPVVVTGGTLAANQAGDLGGTLTVQGGTVVGSVATSLPASVNIAGGTVSVPSMTSFPTTATVNLSGGTLAFTGSSATSATQTVNVSGTAATLDVASGSLANFLGTQIVGTAGSVLTKTGLGTFGLGSSGTAALGTLNVNAGVFRQTSQRAANVGGTGGVNFAAGTTLYNLDTTSFTLAGPQQYAGTVSFNGGDGANVAGVTGSAAIVGTTTGSGAYLHVLDEAGSAVAGFNSPVSLTGQNRFTLTVGTVGSGTRTAADTVTDVFLQPISGTGGLTKDGEGHLVLAATNTYTGPTTLDNGYLYYTGNSSAATGAVTVKTGTTVGGAGGTVGGPITVQSGGTLRGDTSTLPTGGAATGVLTTANVTVQSGGRLGVNLAAAGTNSQLAVGTSRLNFATGSTVALTSITGFDPTAAASYTLASFASGSGGNLQLNGATVGDGVSIGRYTQGSGATGAVTLDVTGVSGLTTGNTFNLARAGDNLVLVFTPVPVPEPGLVLLLAAGGLLAARRKKLQ